GPGLEPPNHELHPTLQSNRPALSLDVFQPEETHPCVTFFGNATLVGNFAWGALARLGLARAFAIQGDTAKAKAAYQDFLTLWKDADPDIPILIAAKAEYAKLK
ncbi:MAG TPA: hypothetical protein VJX72_14675, partial [Candidatus Acidoferrum sp.]|nr:hypothetical protein [Candidatus Acidoferrum sp.]